MDRTRLVLLELEHTVAWAVDKGARIQVSGRLLEVTPKGEETQYMDLNKFSIIRYGGSYIEEVPVDLSSERILEMRKKGFIVIDRRPGPHESVAEITFQYQREPAKGEV